MISPSDRMSCNFHREVFCMLGLPVDNLGFDAAKALFRKLATERQSAVLSTINVNWVVQSFDDNSFRSNIHNSEMVILDGKPLVWLSRLLGYPMREVVPGSSLIEDLLNEKYRKPLTIFLFGGESNTAEIAGEKINRNQKGLRAVGSYNPGFGTVEEMSKSEIIDNINKASPDILLVALGAKKGMQWIELNRHRLKVGVISHLGATINFLAGTVKRAPLFMQNIGIEWMWRIMQEPKLFYRYGWDGLILCQYILKNLFLFINYINVYMNIRNELGDRCKISIINCHELEISVGRIIFMKENYFLREIFSQTLLGYKIVLFNFYKTDFFDGEFAGYLVLLKKILEDHSIKIKFVNLNKKVLRLFKFYGLH